MIRDLLLRLFAYMLGMTVVSAVIGMAMANLFRPGEGMAIDLRQNAGAAGASIPLAISAACLICCWAVRSPLWR
jgi:Na+/H+-dicarboxylate symporter